MKALQSLIELSDITQEHLIEEMHIRLREPVLQKYYWLDVQIAPWEYRENVRGGNWAIFKIFNMITHENVMTFIYDYSLNRSACALYVSSQIRTKTYQYQVLKQSYSYFKCVCNADIYEKLDSIIENVFEILKIIYR